MSLLAKVGCTRFSFLLKYIIGDRALIFQPNRIEMFLISPREQCCGYSLEAKKKGLVLFLYLIEQIIRTTSPRRV